MPKRQEVVTMADIDVTGTFYGTGGLGKRPVVFVDAPFDDQLDAWRNEHKLFTDWLMKRHPVTGKSSPVLYPPERFVRAFKDGDSVTVSLGTRHDKRGTGMKTLNVRRS